MSDVRVAGDGTHFRMDERLGLIPESFGTTILKPEFCFSHRKHEASSAYAAEHFPESQGQ